MFLDIEELFFQHALDNVELVQSIEVYHEMKNLGRIVAFPDSKGENTYVAYREKDSETKAFVDLEWAEEFILDS